MLTSMSNAVITVDAGGAIRTCNKAGLKMLRVGSREILGVNAKDFFFERNPLIAEKIALCEESKSDEILVDVDFADQNSQEPASGNFSFLPLMNQDPDGRMDQVDDHLGTLVMIEDI